MIFEPKTSGQLGSPILPSIRNGDSQRTHRNHAASLGYTLFELNLALAILTVAILTSIYMVRNSATFVRASGDLTLASQLVDSVMDEAHVSDIFTSLLF